MIRSRGGGGGFLRFGLVGDRCAADSSGPIPMFRGSFSKKKVPMFRDFSEKWYPLLAIISNFSGKPRKILKIRPMFRNFFMKNRTHILGFLSKNRPKMRHIHVCLKMWVPPTPGDELSCLFKLLYHGHGSLTVENELRVQTVSKKTCEIDHV